MKLAYAYSSPDWLIVLYDAKQKPILRLSQWRGESIEHQALRLSDRAKKLGLLPSLLGADTYPGAIGPKQILDAVKALYNPLIHNQN